MDVETFPDAAVDRAGDAVDVLAYRKQIFMKKESVLMRVNRCRGILFEEGVAEQGRDTVAEGVSDGLEGVELMLF